VADLTRPYGTSNHQRGAPISKGGGESKMDGHEDLSTMNDPDFLAERKRVRETIEALQEEYRRLDIEFDRRAAAKWAGSDVA
jgi:hypothetical protein